MGYSSEMAFRTCPWCGLRDAMFNALATNAEASRAAGGAKHWSFLSCPRCAGVVALETTPPNNPPKVRSSVPGEEGGGVDVEHLPNDVEDYYSQARRALDADLPDAAAVALRRTLEAAASHFEHDEKVLVQRIEGLISDGLITKQFGDVLHQVRKIGNIGAHASDERVTEETARQVLGFTTQILRNLFEIPAALEALTGATAKP